MTRIREKGQYKSPFSRKTTQTRLPFIEELRAIALIADKHPQSERLLSCVVKIARELAIADGVDLSDLGE